jgi:hypothetical protein
MGIIFVKSSEVIDGNGNHTGSKITYEMLMQEAQKAGADDVINIRIDIDQKEEFAFEGTVPVRVTYNYTASALAIKYTNAAAVVSIANTAQNLGNNEIVQEKLEKPAAPGISASTGTKNNWFSAGAGIGGGLKYERMINPQFSVGAEFYYQANNFLMLSNEVGIEASACFYPWSKTFFLGLGLGYHGFSYFWEDNIYSGYYSYRETVYDTSGGFAVTPQVGWKIPVGQQRRYFFEPGIKIPIIFGDRKIDSYDSSMLTISYVPYVGFGVGF